MLDLQNSEISLRLLSLLTSIASIPIFFIIANKAYKNRTAVFTAFTFFLFNPFIITFTKVFKHYTVEIFTHLLIILLCIGYLKSDKFKYLLLLCATLILSPFFSGANIVFLYPGAYSALIAKKFKDRRALPVILGTGFINLSIILSLYLLVWKKSMSRFIGAWEDRYNGFVENDEPYLSWLIQKTDGLLDYFFNYPRTDLDTSIGILFFTLMFLSLVTLIKKKDLIFSSLLLLPILMAVFFNFLGYWPLGYDRTNLFLIPYISLLTFYGIGQIQIKTSPWISSSVATVSILAIVILTTPNRLDYFKYTDKIYGNPHEDFMSVIKYIASEKIESERPDLYINLVGKIAFDYYINHHDECSRLYKDKIMENFNVHHYESRENEFVYEKTKSILANQPDKIHYFLFYHHSRESNAFYSALQDHSFNYQHRHARSIAAKAIYLPDSEINVFDIGEEIDVHRPIIPDFNLAEIKDYALNSSVKFFVRVSKKGDYILNAEVLAKTSETNSWHISINKGPKQVWSFPKSENWEWDDYNTLFELDKGVHLIEFYYREPTPLRKVMLSKLEK